MAVAEECGLELACGRDGREARYAGHVEVGLKREDAAVEAEVTVSGGGGELLQVGGGADEPGTGGGAVAGEEVGQRAEGQAAGIAAVGGRESGLGVLGGSSADEVGATDGEGVALDGPREALGLAELGVAGYLVAVDACGESYRHGAELCLGEVLESGEHGVAACVEDPLGAEALEGGAGEFGGAEHGDALLGVGVEDNLRVGGHVLVSALGVACHCAHISICGGSDGCQ